MHNNALANAICLIAVICAAYVIGIYPLLLALWARIRPCPIQRKAYTPTVSFVVATYNGASFLDGKLKSIFALDYPRDLLEVIVVSDGSTDNTREIIERYSGRVKFIQLVHAGKATALNHGMSVATGEILVFTDVRQRLAPDSLRLLMENFADPRVGVASGELQIASDTIEARLGVGAYWKYERWIRLNLSAIDSIFGATGAYYAVRRELAISVPPNKLADDMFLPLHAFLKGYRLIVDARAKMYDYATDLATEFSRKVRTLAGNYQILASYPQLLGPKNRLLLHFISYKVGRLALPFLLAVAAIASVVAGGVCAELSALLQGAMWLAITIDVWTSAKSPVKRLTSPVTTFVVMMAATLFAISVWFVPAQRLWRPTQISRQREAIP